MTNFRDPESSDILRSSRSSVTVVGKRLRSIAQSATKVCRTFVSLRSPKGASDPHSCSASRLLLRKVAASSVKSTRSAASSRPSG